MDDCNNQVADLRGGGWSTLFAHWSLRASHRSRQPHDLDSWGLIRVLSSAPIGANPRSKGWGPSPAI